ncbi:hypothetical protein I79_005500 [Cricetulus griseus]|uniref:Uncharacterized protein n=1 Tax=Cricetulus griseus TaxID=10029 RepID=G3H5C0_CRIGR|nr:hypothetical protein I79_005500 [Cricetulus griseus]
MVPQTKITTKPWTFIQGGTKVLASLLTLWFNYKFCADQIQITNSAQIKYKLQILRRSNTNYKFCADQIQITNSAQIKYKLQILRRSNQATLGLLSRVGLQGLPQKSELQIQILRRSNTNHGTKQNSKRHNKQTLNIEHI